MEWRDFQKNLIDWLKSNRSDEELIDIINTCPHQTGKELLMSIAVKEINIRRRKDKIKQIQEKLIK
jgi:hypothetical protein